MAIIRQLQRRDQEVRAHEAAHLAAAGGYANGGASFVYQKGPDGKIYAIGGEVGIDSGPDSSDPQATLQKAQAIRRAALAPAKPSAQDRQVAAAASRMEALARMELARLTMEESAKTDTKAAKNLESNEETDNKENQNNYSDSATSQAIGAYKASGFQLMSDAESPIIDLYA